MPDFARVSMGNPEGLLDPPREDKQASIAELVVTARSKTYRVPQQGWQRGARHAAAGLAVIAGGTAVTEAVAGAAPLPSHNVPAPKAVAPAVEDPVPFPYVRIYTDPSGAQWYALGKKGIVEMARALGYEVVGGHRIEGADVKACYVLKTAALAPTVVTPSVAVPVPVVTAPPVVSTPPPVVVVPPVTVRAVVVPPTTVAPPVAAPPHRAHKVSAKAVERAAAKKAAQRKATAEARAAATRARAAKHKANVAARAARAHAALEAKLTAEHEAAAARAAALEVQRQALADRKAATAARVSAARAAEREAKAAKVAAAEKAAALKAAKSAPNVATQIYDYLIANGLSSIAATGILGNFESESPGLNPQRIELTPATVNLPRSIPAQDLPAWIMNDSGLGWGLPQSTPPSKLIDWVRSQGGDPNDALWQVKWICAELAGSPLLAQLNAAPTSGAAAEMFESGFERPRTLGDRGTRARQAQTFFDDIASPPKHAVKAHR